MCGAAAHRGRRLRRRWERRASGQAPKPSGAAAARALLVDLVADQPGIGFDEQRAADLIQPGRLVRGSGGLEQLDYPLRLESARLPGPLAGMNGLHLERLAKVDYTEPPQDFEIGQVPMQLDLRLFQNVPELTSGGRQVPVGESLRELVHEGNEGMGDLVILGSRPDQGARRDGTDVLGTNPELAKRLHESLPVASGVIGVDVMIGGDHGPQEVAERHAHRRRVVESTDAHIEHNPGQPRNRACEPIYQVGMQAAGRQLARSPAGDPP